MSIQNLMSDRKSRRLLGAIQTTIQATGNTWIPKDPKIFGNDPISGTVEISFENQKFISDQTGAIEISLAGLVQGRRAAVFRKYKFDIRKFLKDYDLTPDQIEAATNIFDANITVVQGAAGTGKTFLIHVLCLILRKNNIIPTLLAPTGRAALNLWDKIGIRANTLHKFLRYDGQKFQATRDNITQPRMIFIDEAFMVSNDCWLKLLEVIDPSTPIVLFGDYNQLYPVSPGAFMTDLIESNLCPTSILTTNKRFLAAGSMLEVSTSILNGKIPRESHHEGGFHLHHKYSGNTEKLVGQETTYKHIPHIVNDLLLEMPDIDLRILAPIYESELGVNQINLAMKSFFNPGNTDAIPILNKVNDYTTNIMNGDRGVWHPRSSFVQFNRGRQIYDPTKHETAYATSIHISQGSESLAVVLGFPIHPQSDFRALYTGVTRAAIRYDHVGRPEQLEKAVKEGPLKRFTLLGRLLTTGAQYEYADHREQQESDPDADRADGPRAQPAARRVRRRRRD